jgi:hypothetical protein
MAWDEGYLATRPIGDEPFPALCLMPLTFGRLRVVVATDEYSAGEHY